MELGTSNIRNAKREVTDGGMSLVNAVSEVSENTTRLYFSSRLLDTIGCPMDEAARRSVAQRQAERSVGGAASRSLRAVSRARARGRNRFRFV